MTIKYFPELIQGGDEWLAARCGLLTASEMKLIMTPTLKPANNDKQRAHLFEIVAQRVTKYVEPQYVSDDMLRGKDDEIEARIIYSEKYGEVADIGFVTNDAWGFTIGYSPDGLVGTDGLIECKSRRQRFQMETYLNYIRFDRVPEEYMLQIQTGLLVTGRQWLDFVSYSGGLPMVTLRVYPDPELQDLIINAATVFERKVTEAINQYRMMQADESFRLIPTERRVEQEMFV